MTTQNNIRSVIRRARQLGITLQDISYISGVTIPTVMKYSASVANKRRLDRAIVINSRTGMIIKAYKAKAKVKARC